MATASGGASLGGATATSARSKSETVNYLLLYESMVRHQDLEFDATHDHIALTVERIQYLGRRSDAPHLAGEDVAAPRTPGGGGDGAPPPPGMLTYLQMRRCLLRLGYTWNRSLPPSVSSGPDDGGCPYDDDVSVLSTGSGSTLHTSGNSSGSVMGTRDIIATDAQLIMLLTTLVEMEERYRAWRMGAADEEEPPDDGEDAMFTKGLYLPEFIQAYKLIIGGMQSLQTYPNPESGKDAVARACDALGMDGNDAASLREIRTRSRERTLGLLRLFGPDPSLYKDDAHLSRQSSGESPGQRKKKSDGLQSTPTRNKAVKSSRRGGKEAKDGLLPRMSEEEIRKMVHTKDAALAKILEDHESEMNVMAVNMEQLRSSEARTQRLMRKRRKRTRAAFLVGTLLLVVGGGFYEYHRREQIKVEIAAGRESERRDDREAIAGLESDVSELKSRLADAEATIRYEEGRYASITKKHEAVARKLAETEGRLLLDQRELERCRVSRKELHDELTVAKDQNEEVDEEVTWCRERLGQTERAMDGMERALKKSREAQAAATKAGASSSDGSGDGIVVPSFADIARELEGEDSGAANGRGVVQVAKKDKGGRGGSKHRPVQMEMKYNRSFRNAVILRQVYSAAGGMLLSALFPGVGKIVGLFLK